MKPPVHAMGNYGRWHEKLQDVTEKSVRRDQKSGQHRVSRLGLAGGCRHEEWPNSTEESIGDLLGTQGRKCLGKPSVMPLKF